MFSMGAVTVFTQPTSQKVSADPVYKIHFQAALIVNIDIAMPSILG